MKTTLHIPAAIALISVAFLSSCSKKPAAAQAAAAQAAAALAQMKSEAKRTTHGANVLNVFLWIANKGELKSTHDVAVCDIGPSRIGILLSKPINDDVTWGVNLPYAGEEPKSGSDWGGNFTYSYADGTVECRYFDVDFRIRDGAIEIGETKHPLDAKLVLVYDPQTKTVETRKLEVETATGS